jgi:hypothetical protein
MRNPTSAFAVCASLLAWCASVRADDLLERAATLDPTIHWGDVFALSIQPLVQTRWTGAEAAGEDPQSAMGFSVPRARLTVDMNVVEILFTHVRVGVKSDGDARFEQAFVEGRWRSLRLRAGQLPLHLNAGEEPQPNELSTADYSSYANTFAGGQTQGAELAYVGAFLTKLVVSNGARSGFSELLSPIVADIAVTGRLEVPIGPRKLVPLVQPSFRGAPTTARIGATGHYQERGPNDTNATPAYDLELASGDVDVRGSGFSLIASASYLRFARHDGTPPNEQLGFMLFASVFAARRVELFGQFDAVWPIGTTTPLPANVASGQPGTTPFRTLTAGADFFVIPHTNRFKVQVDLQTMFDGQSTSVVPSDVSRGVLSTSGPQVAVRVQIVASL